MVSTRILARSVLDSFILLFYLKDTRFRYNNTLYGMRRDANIVKSSQLLGRGAQLLLVTVNDFRYYVYFCLFQLQLKIVVFCVHQTSVWRQFAMSDSRGGLHIEETFPLHCRWDRKLRTCHTSSLLNQISNITHSSGAASCPWVYLKSSTIMEAEDTTHYSLPKKPCMDPVKRRSMQFRLNYATSELDHPCSCNKPFFLPRSTYW